LRSGREDLIDRGISGYDDAPTNHATGSGRTGVPPPQPITLWVHRGFVRSDRVDAISTAALERLLAYEQEELPRWLEAQGVPQSIIAIITRGRVDSLIGLGQRDIDLIGPRSPVYDAWIEARCLGSRELASWTVRELPPQVPAAEVAHAEERRQCEVTRVDAERRYHQSVLRTVLDAAIRRQALRVSGLSRQSTASAPPRRLRRRHRQP